MSDISRLVVAWVSAQQRHFHSSTRGIATPEQRMAWEREAEEIIAAHDREVAAGALRDAAEKLLNGTWPEGFFTGVTGAARELTTRAKEIERDQV